MSEEKKPVKKKKNTYFKGDDIREEILKLAQNERRTFSNMVEMLCFEALVARGIKIGRNA